ncbi:MAG: hypothetical protein ACOYXB_00555 [Bacteroidota bacterium]
MKEDNDKNQKELNEEQVSALSKYIDDVNRRNEKQERRLAKKRDRKVNWRRLLRHIGVYSQPFIGIGYLVLSGYKLVHVCSPWDQVFNTIAVVLIGSGLLTIVMTVLKVFSYFEEELSNILYGKEFLKDRQDLPILWSNVTEALYHQRFPKIAKKIHTLLEDHYFKASNNYYSSYIDLKLNLIDQGDGYVITKDAIVQKINVADLSLKRFPISSNLDCDLSEKDNPISYNRLLELKINGKLIYKYKEGDDKEKLIIREVSSYKITLTRDMDESGRFLKNKMDYFLDVMGEQQYTIERIVEKKFNLYYNPMKKFVANQIYRRMSVLITYSDSLFVDYAGCGTIDSFIERDPAGVCNLHLEYNGIILPKQGIVIGIARKP